MGSTEHQEERWGVVEANFPLCTTSCVSCADSLAHPWSFFNLLFSSQAIRDHYKPPATPKRLKIHRTFLKKRIYFLLSIVFRFCVCVHERETEWEIERERQRSVERTRKGAHKVKKSGEKWMLPRKRQQRIRKNKTSLCPRTKGETTDERQLKFSSSEWILLIVMFFDVYLENGQLRGFPPVCPPEGQPTPVEPAHPDKRLLSLYRHELKDVYNNKYKQTHRRQQVNSFELKKKWFAVKNIYLY